MRYSKECARKVFDEVDKNKDEAISKTEWSYAVMKFFWSSKEGDPVSFLFGEILKE